MYSLCFYFLIAFSKYTDIIRTIGNTHPASIPALRLFPAFCVTNPTIAGPIEPPMSPAIARSAKSAVPPDVIFADVMLIVPGYIIPTENPHTTQPTSPKTGLPLSAASR